MDRTRLEASGRDYAHLRGLLSLPLGALMILAALGNWEWGPLGSTWLVLACFAAVAALTLPISRHYDERYGRITTTARHRAATAAATIGSVVVTFAGSMLIRSAADWSLDLPVNGLAAALAVALLTYHFVTVGLKAHHVAIWGSLLVAALLPVWGGLSLSDTSNVGLVLAGVAAMASGVLDHRLLSRSLGPPQALDLTGGDVGA